LKRIVKRRRRTCADQGSKGEGDEEKEREHVEGKVEVLMTSVRKERLVIGKECG
jgi:hypothetical protein